LRSNLGIEGLISRSGIYIKRRRSHDNAIPGSVERNLAVRRECWGEQSIPFTEDGFGTDEIEMLRLAREGRQQQREQCTLRNAFLLKNEFTHTHVERSIMLYAAQAPGAWPAWPAPLARWSRPTLACDVPSATVHRLEGLYAAMSTASSASEMATKLPCRGSSAVPACGKRTVGPSAAQLEPGMGLKLPGSRLCDALTP
jgi:hypothetical protein